MAVFNSLNLNQKKMKIVGYFYNKFYGNYDVFVANATTYTVFVIDKSELDAILKIDNNSLVEFIDYREAITVTASKIG